MTGINQLWVWARPRCRLESQELTQENLRRNYNWPMDAKTVSRLIGKVHDQLKSVGCPS